MTRSHLLAVGALAGATLLLEGALLRLLAVAQFYHFAFLVVSLALLGFGASGTLLSLSSRWQSLASQQLLAWAGLGFTASTGLAYGVINWLPFDSYSIAWDRRQLLLLVLYYLVLTLPFLCSGLGIGAALSTSPGRSHLVYAANLVGSAGGALLAPLALSVAGIAGAVVLSALLALLPALSSWRERPASPRRRVPLAATGALLVTGLVALAGLAMLNLQGRAPLGLVISPYKGLAHALRYPGAVRGFGASNAIARVDVVANAGTRQLPGLSYTYLDAPPPQLGLAVDADAPLPITLVAPEEFAAAEYLPEGIAFDLRANGKTLVLQPGGGLGVLQAVAAGASSEVTAVVANPLVLRAISTETGPEHNVYSHPLVETITETARVHLERDQDLYDLIFWPLTDSYRPVTSGAYSLAETYDLTVEALVAALDRLAPDGLLVMTRWLQSPPSEEVRLIATVIEALERQGAGQPGHALVALQGIQTITVLAQPDGWEPSELDRIRDFAVARRYDLAWAPDIRPEEANRFNRQPAPVVYELTQALLEEGGREDFYDRYPFAVRPATDDHPFFFHFFTWAQTPAVLAALGQTWQPFGGSGYLILVALLALVVALSAALIILPLLAARRRPRVDRTAQPGSWRWRVLAYFALLGVAFLFVEIPLIQRWILLLGHPVYAFTAVVLTLLLFSSLGSALARATWLPRRAAMAALVALALVTPWVLGWLAEGALGLPLGARVGLGVLSLAPLATLMGLPFPLGLAWLEDRAATWAPWAWAINGCASVIASVLAAILALSAGFTAVLLLGAGAYALAGLALRGER